MGDLLEGVVHNDRKLVSMEPIFSAYNKVTNIVLHLPDLLAHVSIDDADRFIIDPGADRIRLVCCFLP